MIHIPRATKYGCQLFNYIVATGMCVPGEFWKYCYYFGEITDTYQKTRNAHFRKCNSVPVMEGTAVCAAVFV